MAIRESEEVSPAIPSGQPADEDITMADAVTVGVDMGAETTADGDLDASMPAKTEPPEVKLEDLFAGVDSDDDDDDEFPSSRNLPDKSASSSPGSPSSPPR